MIRSIGSSMLVALAAGFAAMSTTSAAEIPTTQPVVVVELFTSEGCSSCPPADAVMAEFAKPDAVDGVQIVPLAIHVDYWNRLGWADGFSSVEFSERQRQYARIFNADQIYTPQMIVDGTQQFVGSDRNKAVAAITTAAAQSKGNLAIALSRNATEDRTLDCKVSIDAVAQNERRGADILLAVTEDDLSTDVRRGENAGRTLHHTAVVRILRKVAALKSTDMLPFTASAKVTLEPGWRVDHMHIVAFVQDPTSGRILAAGFVPAGNGRPQK